MKRTEIKITDFKTEIFNLWAEQWLLLTAGEMEHDAFNCMTVAWGSIGYMWNKPFVQVVVRPTRYTYNFIERHDTFTLAAFGNEYKKELGYLGRASGKDENKIQKSGLTAVISKIVACPSYKEAELMIECRKIYSTRFTPQEFIDPSIDSSYPQKDYHSVYFGEVVYIEGFDRFRR
jgi:flavin reductase (DIM6/NTAB) family NADH-FMN oxidoreductase RutF